MDLNVQFLNSKYIDCRKGCPALPPHMGLCIAPVETLPVNGEEMDSEEDVLLDMENQNEEGILLTSRGPSYGEGNEMTSVQTESSAHQILREEDMIEDSDTLSESPVCRNSEMGRGESSDTTYCSNLQSYIPPNNTIGNGHSEGNSQSALRCEIDLSAKQVESRGTLKDVSLEEESAAEFTIRKQALDASVNFPLRHSHVPKLDQSVRIASNLGSLVSSDPICIDSSPPRYGFSFRGHSAQNAQKVSGTTLSSEPNVLAPQSFEKQNVDSIFNWTAKVSCSPALSPSQHEGHASAMNLSSASPFTTLMEKYSVEEPSSIAKRCLQQKRRPHSTKVSKTHVPLRNPNNVVSLEDSPQRLPLTPTCGKRVIVVIPDTPVIVSREVIDLTDSPM